MGLYMYMIYFNFGLNGHAELWALTYTNNKYNFIKEHKGIVFVDCSTQQQHL